MRHGTKNRWFIFIKAKINNSSDKADWAFFLPIRNHFGISKPIAINKKDHLLINNFSLFKKK